MKIALYDTLINGHHINYLLPILNFLNKKNVEVLFITSKEIREHHLHNKIKNLAKIKYLDINSSKNPFIRIFNKTKEINKAYKHADNWNADTFHFLYFDFLEIPLLFLNLLNVNKFNFKVICTLHWVHFSGNFLGEDRNKIKSFYDYVQKKSLNYLFKTEKIDKLFIHIDEMKIILNKELNIDNNLIETIPYPTDIFDKKLSQKEARKNLNLPAKKVLFLFFGGLRYDKGIDLLLKCVSRIEGNFKLIIAGKEDYFKRKDIKLLIKNNNIQDKVITRIEFIPEDEMGLYFISSDAVVLPYRNIFKGQSGPLLQACYAQKPIIAFNSGILGEIVKNNNLGILAKSESVKDLGDKLDYFMNNMDYINKSYNQNLINYYKSNQKNKMVKSLYKKYLNISSKQNK